MHYKATPNLEDRLKFICENNDQYKQLYDIYNFNKPMITSSLDRITDYYFQYSDHGEKHSRNIIMAIEKVLGEKGIEYLSPTDIFIILLSAYLHDFSMSISYNEVTRIVESEFFSVFLEEIESNNDFYSDVQNVKNTEYSKDNIKKLLKTDVSLKRLVAEFRRKEHSYKSKEIILNLFQNSEININPNNILPDRIIGIIAEICSFHGENIDNIKNFEMCENGVFHDEIHPRFIAILIRIGDLLDLDSNRYDQQLLNSRSKLNCDSQKHYNKHKSITHLYISPAKISISAECGDEEILRDLYSWCQWLENELIFLQNNITDIIPDDWIIRIPTLNTKLNRKGVIGHYSKNNLSINIKREQAFEIITGSTIYNNKFAFLREYLQNALDASKIKLWQELLNSYPFTNDYEADNINIQRKLFEGEYKHLLSKFDITIDILNYSIDQVKADGFKDAKKLLADLYECNVEDSDNQLLRDLNNGNLIIVIQDNGTGISKETIDNKILSPGINYKQKQISDIHPTPRYLQATGSFGIGIHSAFMVTNKVYFKTKCIGDTCYKDLIIYSSKEKGWVEYVEKEYSKKHSILKSGTKAFISFNQGILKDDIDLYKIKQGYYFSYDILIEEIISTLVGVYKFDLFKMTINVNGKEIVNEKDREWSVSL